MGESRCSSEDARHPILSRAAVNSTLNTLSPSTSDRPHHKYIQLIIMFVLNIFSFYLIFCFLLLLFKFHIVCFLISNWKVELTHFEPWSAPLLPESFLDEFHLLQAPDQHHYVNFTLSIENNPSWLTMNIRHVDLHYGIGLIGTLSHANIAFSGDTAITVVQQLDLAYRDFCLPHILATEKSVPSVATFEAEASLFGHTVDLLEVSALVSFGVSGRSFSGVGIDKDAARGCEVFYEKEVRDTIDRASFQAGVTVTTIPEFTAGLPLDPAEWVKQKRV